MALAIYNTLTSQTEPFTPLVADHVSMYVCGPTVYSCLLYTSRCV